MHQQGLRQVAPTALLPTDLEVEARRMVEQDQVVKEADTLGISLVEYQLRKMQEALGVLSDLRGKITPKLLESDPLQFEILTAQAEKVIRDSQVVAIAFIAQVQSEYAQASPMRRFWSTVMGLIFVSWQRYVDAQKRRTAHRVALLQAGDSYEKITQDYERHIQDVKDSRFHHRQHELLAADARYQKVVHEEREAQTDISWLRNVTKSQATAVKGMLEKLCGRWNEGRFWYYSDGRERSDKEYINCELTLIRLQQLLPVRVTANTKEREFLEQHALLTAREEVGPA